jgi:exosortase E/protease (VPEID-CTERM system)
MRSPASQTGFWLYARLWSFVALLLAELLLLEVRFDTAALLDVHQWWAEAIGRAYLLPHLAIAILAAMLLFGGPKLQQVFLEIRGDLCRPHPLWPILLVCHFAALAGFVGLTAFILEGPTTLWPAPAIWLLGWAAAGLAVVGFWMASAAPPAVWASLARQAFWPVLAGVLVGIAAWAAGELSGDLWRPLAASTFQAVNALLAPLVPGFFADSSALVMGSSAFSAQIGPACSGVEGIGLILVFLTLYLWSYRRNLRFPRALILLPLGIVAIWLCNIARIAILILIGTWISRAVALGGFHSQAGWLAFNGVALGLVAVAVRSPFFLAATDVTAGRDARNPAAPYLVPFLAVVAVTMLAAAFSAPGQPDWFYPLRVLAAGCALWAFRDVYRKWSWTWSWSAVAIGLVVCAAWVVMDGIWPGGGAAAPIPLEAGALPVALVAAWWCLRVVGYVLAAPLAEELAFRGYLTRRLISADFQELPMGSFSWLALLVSSALFGAMHGSHWPAGIVAGMLFAWALYRRARIADAVLAHATANASLAIYAATTGNWQLWS